MADTPERAKARGFLHRVFPEATNVRDTEKKAAKHEKDIEEAGKEEGVDKNGTDAGEMEPKWDDRFKKG